MKNQLNLLVLGMFAFFLFAEQSCAVDFLSNLADQGKKRKPTYAKETEGIAEGKILSELVPLLYQGGERLSYDISWSGGVKVGEATVEINRVKNGIDAYELKVRVTSKGGALAWLYPVDDLHVTIVNGAERLPVRHESWQKEGYNYRAHKVTRFDQQQGQITYWKNDNPPQLFAVDGKTQNEFSAFMASRLMPFIPGRSFVVPTWADKKRVKVIVEVGGIEKIKNTVFGTVDVIKVMPILTFSGTYDQRGDTTIFYTHDECRIPLEVQSKIIIGRLTASLVAWENPACRRYRAIQENN